MLFVFLIIINFVFSEVLYGLGQGNIQLNKIDTATVKMTPIGKSIPEMEGSQLASMDSKNKIFYLISYNATAKHCYLTGLDIGTGDVKYHIQLPFEESEFVGVGQAIQVKLDDSGDVFVVGQESDQLHHIYEVKPSTSKKTKIATIGDLNVLGGVSAYNPVSKMLYLQYGVDEGIDIFGWNVMTGKLEAQNTVNMETMDYDPTTQKIWGIGLKTSENGATRTLITLDMKNEFEEIAEIDGYLMIDGDMSAIDVKNRQIFAILQKTGSTSNDPFQLLSIDMKDGKVFDNPDCYMLQGDPLCPWSLEKYAIA